MYHALRTASAALGRGSEIVAAGLLLVVTIINLVQVAGRYSIGFSLPWGEEIMRYTMVWVMMIGGVACFWRVEHMSIDALHDMAPARLRPLVRGALYGIAGIFCFLLAWYGWPAAFANSRQYAAASGISMFWVYLAIPVGATLMIVQIVLCWLTGYRPVDARDER